MGTLYDKTKISQVKLPGGETIYRFEDKDLREMVYARIYAVGVAYSANQLIYVATEDSLYKAKVDITAAQNTSLDDLKAAPAKVEATTITGEIEARYNELKNLIEGGVHYRGYTTTALVDGATTNPITIDGASYTALSGDLVIYVSGAGTANEKEEEFIFNGTKWNEFGSTGALKALAFADTATGSTTLSTVDSASFTNGAVSASATYTPTGTVSKPSITVTPSIDTYKVGDSDGSVTPGSDAVLSGGKATVIDTTKFSGGNKAADTFDGGSQAQLTTSVANEVLTISFTPNTVATFSEGAFTPAAFQTGFAVNGTDASLSGGKATVVNLPTFKNATLMDDATAELDAAPTFTGDQDTISSTGTATGDVNLTPSTKTIAITVHPDTN